MLITTELNTRAWAIRRLAAVKWKCNVKSVLWKYCLKIAKYNGNIKKVWEKTTNKVNNAISQKKKKGVGRPVKVDFIPFIEDCIRKGNMTRKQIVNATMNRFPGLKKSCLSVTLSNCGNPEKTRLTNNKTFVKNSNKFLVFA